MTSSNAISQKEYLKKYLSGDVKKKKKKKVTGANIKRSVIVDDDIDLKSMRPLEDDEVELYQMDEDAPQIAGIVDERPPEVKAQEYYSSKRWKVFGGEDGVNVVDSMNKVQQYSGKVSKALNHLDETSSPNEEWKYHGKSKLDGKDSSRIPQKDSLEKNKANSKDNLYVTQKDNEDKKASSGDRKYPKNNYNQSDSDESLQRVRRDKSSHFKDDSDASPPRKRYRNSSSDSNNSFPRKKYNKDSKYSNAPKPRFERDKRSRYENDVSPPRRKYDKSHKDSDESPPRRDSRKKSPGSRDEVRKRGKVRNKSNSKSPPRKDRTIKHRYKSDSDNSPPRVKHNYNNQDKSDSDASPPRKMEKFKCNKDLPSRREKHSYKQERSDSDASPPRRTDKYSESKNRSRKAYSSDSDNAARKESRKSPKPQMSRRRRSRSRTPPEKNSVLSKSYREKSPRLSERGTYKRSVKKHGIISDKSSQWNRKSSEGSDSDMSPPRKNAQANDRPLKKALYKPNDDSSSDDEPKSKGKKMKTTLDGKQAGLQDAKQLKKELSDLKMKEDTMFSKMDASVSGVSAAPVRRDRKTGQIRDLEKEKEAQKEQEAKESVVNEKYYKWGKGIKQTEDAAVRAAEAIKEMNKPLARYVDDKDLDEFLKAQDREGDPMLEYIKRKQSESTPLKEEKPIYKGSWNPNRFNIRPGYRWDGVVRSNGYEQEWFKTKNAKKARDEEAYKWSTSDM